MNAYKILMFELRTKDLPPLKSLNFLFQKMIIRRKYTWESGANLKIIKRTFQNKK